MTHHSHEGTEFLILLIVQMISEPISIMILCCSNMLLSLIGFPVIHQIDEYAQYLTHAIQLAVAVAGAILVRHKWINREKK